MQRGILLDRSQSSGGLAGFPADFRGRQGRVPCIAVTGGVACGKSVFGRILSDQGAEVVDADEIVHRLQRPRGVLSRLIAGEFGKDFLDGQGAVDRERLGALVFADAEARSRLNALCHPVVRRWFQRWRSRPTSSWAKVALIPLLFESGWEEDWDGTVCIAASPDLQLSRLRDRGCSEGEARDRVLAQWPLAEKMKRADVVVQNNAGLEELAASAAHVKQRVLERYSL